LLLPRTEDEVENAADQHDGAGHPEDAAPRLYRYLSITANTIKHNGVTLSFRNTKVLHQTLNPVLLSLALVLGLELS